MTTLIDLQTSMIPYDQDHDVLYKRQTIPSEFLDGLSDQRLASDSVREGEFMKVASVPVATIEKWYAEGFDAMKAPIQDVVARLKAEDLTKFLATNKRV